MLKERKMSSNTMRKITSFLSRICTGLCGIILLGVLFYAFLLKPILVSMLELKWGVDIHIKRVHLNFQDFQHPLFVFESVRVGNPYSFPKGDLLQIHRVQADLGGMEYHDRALNFARMDFFIDHINLMRRVSGHLNLEALLQGDMQKNKKGFSVNPKATRFYIHNLTETDATSPLLQKKEIVLDDQEILVEGKQNFKEVARAFMQKLLQKIPEEKSQVSLPAPEYKGLAQAVEENIREQAQKRSDESTESLSTIEDTNLN